MKCPNCGVDSDQFLKEKAESAERRKKEEKFEQAYGHILRPIRRKRAWAGGIAGFVGGAVLCAVVSLLALFSAPGGVMGLWQGMKKEPWVSWFVVAFFSTAISVMCGLIYAWLAEEIAGKQEKELRKNFGL